MYRNIQEAYTYKEIEKKHPNRLELAENDTDIRTPRNTDPGEMLSEMGRNIETTQTYKCRVRGEWGGG